MLNLNSFQNNFPELDEVVRFGNTSIAGPAHTPDVLLALCMKDLDGRPHIVCNAAERGRSASAIGRTGTS